MRVVQLLTFLACGFVAINVYGAVRGLGIGFGLWRSVLGSFFAALFCILPCIGGIAAAYALHWMRERSGPDEASCAACGYLRTGLPRGTCPECGGREWHDARGRAWGRFDRIAIACVAAWLLTCVAAEGVALLDEAAFRREASRMGLGYSRDRWWPSGWKFVAENRGIGVQGGLD